MDVDVKMLPSEYEHLGTRQKIVSSVSFQECFSEVLESCTPSTNFLQHPPL